MRPQHIHLSMVAAASTTRSMALPSASVLRSVLQSQTRQSSKRFLSTAQQSSRRPIPSTPQQCSNPRAQLPLVQRRCKSRTVEEAKSRYRTGPFSWKAGLLFVLVGGGLVWYFEHEKQRMQRKRIAEATKGVGKPKVGGDFQLVDQEGRPFSSNDLKGQHSLVSFPPCFCSPIRAAQALRGRTPRTTC